MLWHSCKGEVFFMMTLNFQAQLKSQLGSLQEPLWFPTDSSEHTMIM